MHANSEQPQATTFIDGELAAELASFEAAERARLGLEPAREHWTDKMTAPEMKRSERERVTLLVSGLTDVQDSLIEGALKGLGYKVQCLETPDNEALRVGKEYGNRGQCNPTYYTVGGLVKHLTKLRDEQGLSSEAIVRDYLFVTAGACGPCRFGMYATEYRKALRDAGFDGFRVLLFQQQGGLKQTAGQDAGLDLNPKFFVALIKALLAGDLLNAMGHRIRPYEVEAGATDRAMDQSRKLVYRALSEGGSVLWALYRSRDHFEAVKVDKLRPRPKVSVIGEFWAMTTEGDGNYRLKKFLEQEGAEDDIQLTTAWLLYSIWEVDRDTRQRRFLRGADHGLYGLAKLDEVGVAKRLATMRVAEAALRVGFHTFALAIGLERYHLPDMKELAKLADDIYSNDLRGGEGHMEVGKLISNVEHEKAHMTVSVKPFGCMPSSGVSDGVQTLVQARYPSAIFCAVETSGDGAANFYSRVQMYLYKARLVAEKELEETLQRCGVTADEVRAYLSAHPKLANAMHYSPHHRAGSAANLVEEIAPLIRLPKAVRALRKLRSAVETVRSLAETTPARARSAWELARAAETTARLRADFDVLRDLAVKQIARRAA